MTKESTNLRAKVTHRGDDADGPQPSPYPALPPSFDAGPTADVADGIGGRLGRSWLGRPKIAATSHSQCNREPRFVAHADRARLTDYYPLWLGDKQSKGLVPALASVFASGLSRAAGVVSTLR